MPSTAYTAQELELYRQQCIAAGIAEDELPLPPPPAPLHCALCKRKGTEIRRWFTSSNDGPSLCDYCFPRENYYCNSRIEQQNETSEDDLDGEDDEDGDGYDDDNRTMPVIVIPHMESPHPHSSSRYTGFFDRNKLNSETFEFNTSKRFIGCELEVDKLKRPINQNSLCKKINRHINYNNAKLWDAGAIAVSDGSLGAGGFEVCTFPANGDAFLNQIQTVTDVLNRQRAYVNSTCGMHIHVDASDYTAKDICNFMKVYCLIENAIFSTLPRSRRNNTYCKRITLQKETFNFLFTKGVKSSSTATLAAYDRNNYSQRQLEELKRCKKPGSRYKAVNLSSWFYQGTIEFRMFSGTTCAQKIINWCSFWSNLLNLVKTTLNTPQKIYSFLNFDNLNSAGIPYRLSNFEHDDEFSWDCLMKVCSSDTQRTWFTKRKLNFNQPSSF